MDCVFQISRYETGLTLILSMTKSAELASCWAHWLLRPLFAPFSASCFMQESLYVGSHKYLSIILVLIKLSLVNN